MKRDVEKKRLVHTTLIASVLLLAVTVPSFAARQGAGLVEAVRSLNQGDYPRAAALVSAYLEAHPADTAAARIVSARIEIAQGNYETAYQELRKALHSDPVNVDAHYYLGIVSGVLSQIEYQKLYSLAPDSARVHQLMAESFQAQENLADAEAEYVAALKVNPQSTEVLITLGEIKRSQSRFDEAIFYYSRAMEIGPANYDSAYGLGVCYAYRQEHVRAVEYFRQALVFDPNSAPGRFALGNSLWQMGQVSAAVIELQAAVALEPKMRQAYYLLGRAYQRLAQAQQSRAAFKKADELMKLEIETAQQALDPNASISIQTARPPEKPVSTPGQVQPRKKPSRKQ